MLRNLTGAWGFLAGVPGYYALAHYLGQREKSFQLNLPMGIIDDASKVVVSISRARTRCEMLRMPWQMMARERGVQKCKANDDHYFMTAR